MNYQRMIDILNQVRPRIAEPHWQYSPYVCDNVGEVCGDSFEDPSREQEQIRSDINDYIDGAWGMQDWMSIRDGKDYDRDAPEVMAERLKTIDFLIDKYQTKIMEKQVNKIIIDDTKKDAIVTVYQSGTRTIKQIADCVGVSARTIGRILVEKGAMPAKVKKTKEEDAILSAIAASGIGLAGVKQLLDKDVVAILTDIGEEEFQRVTYEAQLYYISKRYNISVQAATLKMQQAVENKV